MKNKTVLLTIISCALVLIPMLVGFILWDRLPEQMATSYGLNGEVTGYSSKLFAVVFLPLILIASNILCIVLTVADPRRKNISNAAIGVVLSIMPLSSIFCGVLAYKDALGLNINVARFATAFLGIVFTIVGFILPKCKQNYTVGIKVPWTLHSEENWNKTHAFGGKVWIVGGAIMTILGILGFEKVMVAGILILALLPMVYSYVYYRKNEKDKQDG
ncbi:MAG: SdpI family protein [Eubacteriales bacterium]|nr:SdpI family protein [Eubacteriales bacterium]